MIHLSAPDSDRQVTTKVENEPYLNYKKHFTYVALDLFVVPIAKLAGDQMSQYASDAHLAFESGFLFSENKQKTCQEVNVRILPYYFQFCSLTRIVKYDNFP